MKLVSKKLVSLLVCLALVLAALPMVVIAADSYVLVDGVTRSITIPAGGSVAIEVDATASDMTLLVTGNRMYYDWYLDTGRTQSSPGPSGGVEMSLPAGSVYTLTIVNVSEEAEQVLDVTASSPVLGSEDTPDQLALDENTCDVASWDMYFYTWTASQAGTLTITIDTTYSSDWCFAIDCTKADGTLVYGDTVWSDVEPVVSSQTVDVEADDVYMIKIGTASGNAGSVRFSASFVAGVSGGETPDEGEGGAEEVTKEAYVISDIMLGLGDNALTLDPSAVTTIYEFCPDEAGVYTFTADDANALVGYWGAGSFYVFDQTENKTNTLERTLENVGPSIMVGISGVETVTLNVEKTGEYVPAPEIPVTVYVNTHTFIDFAVADDAVIVDFDVTDDEPDVVVLGEDGFYHLGSADGDLVVTDLADAPIGISGAIQNGQLTAYVYDESGVAIEKIDYNDAMKEYLDKGLYPVTEELANMIQHIGESKGWWEEGGFVFGEGETPSDPDMAWLSFCSYVEGMTSTDPEEPEDPEEPTEPTEPEPTDPEPTEPEPTDPEPTEPEPTDPEPTDPEPTDPEPTEPEPTEPEPTDPEPTDPEPTEPEPTEPEPTEPEPTEPEPTDPEPTEPEPTDPEPTEPEPTEPEPTDPEPTEPEPTEPEPTEPEPTDPEPTEPEPTDPEEPTEPEEPSEPEIPSEDEDLPCIVKLWIKWWKFYISMVKKYLSFWC